MSEIFILAIVNVMTHLSQKMLPTPLGTEINEIKSSITKFDDKFKNHILLSK